MAPSNTRVRWLHLTHVFLKPRGKDWANSVKFNTLVFYLNVNNIENLQNKCS